MDAPVVFGQEGTATEPATIEPFRKQVGPALLSLKALLCNPWLSVRQMYTTSKLNINNSNVSAPQESQPRQEGQQRHRGDRYRDGARTTAADRRHGLCSTPAQEEIARGRADPQCVPLSTSLPPNDHEPAPPPSSLPQMGLRVMPKP